jgi:hypothetical protein
VRSWHRIRLVGSRAAGVPAAQYREPSARGVTRQDVLARPRST